MKTVKLQQDKVLKHSVRYSTPDGAPTFMSVYVPKEFLVDPANQVPQKNGWPQHLTLTISLGDGQ